MSQEGEQLQERIVALEKNVEWLVEAYKDIAWIRPNGSNHLDNFAKRIEVIRDEVNSTLNTVVERFNTETAQKVAETTAKLNEVVENAKQSLSHDALVAALAEHKQQILGVLVDPSTGRLRHR